MIDLFKALKAGKQLKNPEVWANRQSLANICATIISFVVGAAKLLGLEVPVTDAQILEFGSAAAVILGTGNAIISVATTKDAGVK